jgi:hypothetical protein
VREGKPDKSWYEKTSTLLEVKTKIEVTGKNKTSEYPWYPTFFLETFIYEIFLIVNLAVPGAGNFYTLTISGEDVSHPSKVQLSAFSFENGLVETLDGAWPALQILPIKEVSDWFDALNIGYKQRAETPIEKVLYVLLHMARRDVEIESFIWLFHALEALVSTKVGESISGLVRRLSMLLELQPVQQKHLNKKLRELYDLRSSFVHGGYAVLHPNASEVVDRSLDKHQSDLYEYAQFGASLLIVTVQQLIKKKIIDLQFTEHLRATTIK